MIIEGHLSNDEMRFRKKFHSIHKLLDATHKTKEFCTIPLHTLDYLLMMYEKEEISLEELRAGIFHLLDDFGIIPLKEDWNSDEHWLGQYCKQKLKEDN